MDVFSLVLRLKEEGAQQVKTSVDKLNRSFDDATMKTKLYDSTIGSLKGAFAGLAGAVTVGAVFSKIASETSQAEFAAAQLNAALKSTNFVAGQSAAALNKHAQALAVMSTYDDDAITGAQALLLTFTKIQGDTFPKATQAIVDMATAMNTDLKGATIQVGKALNDPIMGVTALARAGVQFSAAQKEVIAQMVETGRQSEAQALILRELETQFGGSAKAARETFGGALKALANELGNVFTLGEKGSGLFVGVINNMIYAVRGLNAVLSDLGNSLGVVKGPLMAVVGFLGNTMEANLYKKLIARGKEISDEMKIAEATSYSTSLVQGAFEQIKQRQIEINQLIKLAEVRNLNTEQTKILRGEAARLTAEMNRQGLSMQGQYEVGKRLLEVQNALALKGPKKEKLKLSEVSDIGSAFATARSAIPLQELVIPVVPKVQLSPEMANGKGGIFNKVGADFVNGWAEMMDSIGDKLSNILVDSVASAFENLAATGGSLKSAFKVLTSGLLSGLGGMLIEFGRYVIVAGKLMAGVQTALKSMNPVAGIAAGLAMIAIGGMLRGAASRSFSTPSGGGGGGYSAPSMQSGSFGLATQYYGPTAAGSANTIERINPVSVTIIGPNDPSAQRQMQELMRNAQRRGSV